MNARPVLSLFPGIDLLGRGFEAEGFCVVRGPDLIFGGDVRSFHVPPRCFAGVIAGSPCQDFSRARRAPPTGKGDAAIGEFRRLVTEARPDWWLLENVPGVPDVRIEGFSWLRIDIDARDCGVAQSRRRHFQFGHVEGFVPIVRRIARAPGRVAACALASEASRPARRGWSEFCALQGLPGDFALPGMTIAARYAAVGNGVPVPVARTIAAAIRDALPPGRAQLCACGCARLVSGKRRLATVACRKRMQRRRDALGVTFRGRPGAAGSRREPPSRDASRRAAPGPVTHAELF